MVVVVEEEEEEEEEDPGKCEAQLKIAFRGPSHVLYKKSRSFHNAGHETLPRKCANLRDRKSQPMHAWDAARGILGVNECNIV